MFQTTISDAWAVLVLFLIPVGGGIPAGVLLAKSRAIAWPVMTILYLISDVILACIFEPVMMLFLHIAKRSPIFAKIREPFRKSLDKTIAKYGKNPSPLTLILISFGVDPMTGRSVAMASGHNFVSGWTLAIIGDMIFFTILMVSTLFLNNILGDGTWTAVIIMVLVTVVPVMFRRLRKARVSS